MKLKVFVTLAGVGIAAASLLSERAIAAPGMVLGRFGEEDSKKPKKPAAEKEKEKEKEKDKGDKEKAKPAAKDAKDKEKAKDEKPVAGEIKKRIALAPKGIRWGMSLENLAQLYDKLFEEEYVPLYKKAEPGTQMQALDSELADKKALLRRNKIEFGRLPTGVDQGPLKGEYSYNNGESMSRLKLKSGTERIVFMFDGKLWKIYDEHKLRNGGTLGASFKDAVAILTKKFGTAPVIVQPDYAKGRNFEEAVWKDSTSYIRAVNREPILGMVYADRNIQESLSTYRKNKAENPSAMDRDVSDVIRKPDEPMKKPDEKDAKKKDDKKKAAAKKQ